MEIEVKAGLTDIKQAIEEIKEFLPDKKDFLKFQNDIKTKKAIERNIEIIGEAVNRLLKIKPEIKITSARKIVDTRNRIIHGYDSVSADIIWAIVIKELPELEKEIDALL
ncbi:MAG: HepT-like ribonuclease domain-containing protein [Ignavibacteriaceae bacterium]|nr:HepT-like ribonuclease domain-containing protein [Ignavibacteriaceae bacterium]